MEHHDPRECPICNRCYNLTDDQMRVRSLGCGHSMCTSCLCRIHINNSVMCPQCRTVHPALSVDNIPINFGMEYLIHSPAPGQNTNSTSEGSSVLNGGFCQKHATMKFFYCDICKEYICTHCTILDHKGGQHNIIDIQEAVNIRKTCNLSEIESQIKELQRAKSTFTDRVSILEEAKATHNQLIEKFTNVITKLQEDVVDIDTQYICQSQMVQEAEQKIINLSSIKQQVTTTKTLVDLSVAEQNSITSVRQTENWIKENKDSREFSQLQKRSDIVLTSCHMALSTFDAANSEDGREGLLVLHMTKKDLAAQMNIGPIFVSSINNGILKTAKLKHHKGKIHLPQLTSTNSKETPPEKSLIFPYSSFKTASELSDLFANCHRNARGHRCDCNPCPIS